MKPRAWGLVLGSALLAPLAGGGCVDSCCNSCGRSYSLGTENSGLAHVFVQNVSEGGNECEISDIPRGIPPGLRTFVLEILDRQATADGRASFSVKLEASFAGDTSAQECAGRPVLDAQALKSSSHMAGDRVCVVDESRVEEACTQKGCAGL